jgi:hypothetical protein
MDEPHPPINALPPEILSAIFLPLREIRRYKQLLPFQVHLSHVCRHWRQIAISTPQLWSSITLFSTKSQPCVEEWLARSGSVPLDVRLDLFDADYRGEVTAHWLQNHLAHIVLNVHRFQNLFLFTRLEVNVYHVLQLLHQVEAPLLKRLSVLVGRHQQLRELTPFSTANGDFNLRTSLNGGLPNLNFAELQPLRCIPPIMNVTTLHLNIVGRGTPLHFSQLAEILQMPHNLVTLSLRGHVDRTGWPHIRDRPHIMLSELKNLEISARGATGILFLLAFGAPRLESLRWHVDSDNYHQLLDSPQFQPGSNKFPNLKYLTLVAQSFSPSHLHTLMSIFPTPTHVLGTIPIGARQAPRNMESLFCSPNLEVLALQRIFVPESPVFALELRNALLGSSKIKKVLADTEFLLYLTSTPELGNLVELDEINDDTFPDYWYISDCRSI